MGLESDAFFLQEQVAEAFSAFGQARTGGIRCFPSLGKFPHQPSKKIHKGFFRKKVKYAGSFDGGESIPCQLTIKTVCAEPLFAGGILEESCKRPCEHPFEDEKNHSCLRAAAVNCGFSLKTQKRLLSIESFMRNGA